MNSTATGHCPTCSQQRLLIREKPNHILHLILTVLTVGLWGFVWLAVTATKKNRPARCTVCGTELRHTYAPGQGQGWA
jgi:hypothetical protein